MASRFVIGSLLLILFSCNYTEPTFVRPPQMLPNPNGLAPLVTFLEVEASEPVRVVVAISDGKEHRWEYQVPGRFKQSHRIPISQLQPSSNYEFRVSLRNTWYHRNEKAEVLHFKTFDWPSNYPAFKVSQADRANRRPGFHLLSMSRRDEMGEEIAILLAVNWRGEVMWLLEVEEPLTKLALSKNGHIIGTNLTGYAMAVDLLGTDLGAEEKGKMGEAVSNGNSLLLDKTEEGKDRLREMTMEELPQTLLEIEATSQSQILTAIYLPTLRIK